MMTPQEIREKAFNKAMLGGYDMGAVDRFLEELASELALLQKENATLKGKMKVLVDKVEEYRGNEDALRMAVLSAQKLGNMIEAEAREKAQKMIEQAQAESDLIVNEATMRVSAEQTRLAESKTESAKFIDSMDLLCRHQLEFLQKVGEMDFMQQARSEAAEAPTEAAPEIHETVKSIEETIAKVAGEPASDVRPSFERAIAEDELPTKAFGVVSDPADSVDSTTLFDLKPDVVPAPADDADSTTLFNLK